MNTPCVCTVSLLLCVWLHVLWRGCCREWLYCKDWHVRWLSGWGQWLGIRGTGILGCAGGPNALLRMLGSVASL